MSDVQWYCPNLRSTFGPVGLDAQISLWTKLFEDVVDSDVFAGTIVGGQIFVDVHVSGATPLHEPPELWVLILPVGVTTGPMLTEEDRMELQDYAWLYGKMVPGPNMFDFHWHFKCNTKRRFNRNSNLCFVLVNRDDGVTIPAGSGLNIQLDLYVVPS